MKRLAVFWFVCAAAGFAVATAVALMLAAIDGGPLRLTPTQPQVHALEARPTPRNSLNADDARDVGHDRLMPW